MKTILSSLISFLFFNAITAQNTFVKGYVVTDKGDTVKGEIKLNPKKEHECYAKVSLKDANGMQKNYKPEKTKSYGYENKTFISMESDGEMKFFLVLVSGTINFYKVVFESMKMNEAVYEPEYYLTRSDDSKLSIVKESKFKKQLTEFMKDKPDIAAMYPDDKKFDTEKAIALIKQYNSSK